MHKLLDYSWSGKITKIEIKYTTDSDRGFKPSRETLYTKETVIFHIKTKNRIIKRKVFENNANNDNISKYYQEGDKVLHAGGTDYIQIISKDAEKIF